MHSQSSICTVKAMLVGTQQEVQGRINEGGPSSNDSVIWSRQGLASQSICPGKPCPPMYEGRGPPSSYDRFRT